MPDRRQELLIEPPASFTGSVPSPDHTIELQDLCLQHPQLAAESDDTRTGNLGQPLIICIGGNPEQLLDTMASRLGRDEPHVWPGDRLADRLGVSGIVLVPLHIRLHIGRRHQAHGVAKRLELGRPMMRRGAGFNANQARGQLLEEWQQVAPLELTTEDDIALRIDAMNLKNRTSRYRDRLS